jgi:hypothetical protein
MEKSDIFGPPGIVLATESLKELLPDWRFTILLGDTECNSAQERAPPNYVQKFY